MNTESSTEAQGLCAFIDRSPSPFHAVASAAEMLRNAGFTESQPGLSPGGHFFKSSGSLLAWIEKGQPSNSFRILAAHTDSPNLRITPNHDQLRYGIKQLGVEVYGAALLNSWLDRDLGCSGRVVVRHPSLENPQEILLHLDEPVARIPQLAIHLNRSVNQDGLVLDPHLHLAPVIGLETLSTQSFLELIAERVDVLSGDILGFDLMLHDLCPATFAGMNKEFISAPRLDNLLSVHAAIEALCATSSAIEDPTPIVILCDHEEVGSTSSSGASSPLLRDLLYRLADGLPIDPADSLIYSVDGAHAIHPNYAERHDSNHAVAIDGGPTLKFNAAQRYATDAMGSARVRLAAEKAGIPLQAYSHRADLSCGSTIGPILGAATGLPVVDMGAPQWAMHSAREMCAANSPGILQNLLGVLLSGEF